MRSASLARELDVRHRCDACGALAIHVEVPVRAGAARQATLDLCDECYATLIQPLLDTLAKARPYATATPARPSRQWAGRTVGPFRCALCEVPPLKNLSTFSTHIKSLHGMSRLEYTVKYGDPVPLTAEEVAELEAVEYTCEVPGCGKTYSTALGNRWPHQALRSHMWGVHAIRWQPPATSRSGR